MIGFILAVAAGGYLGYRGFWITDPLFWIVLIPVCILGTAIDRALRP